MSVADLLEVTTCEVCGSHDLVTFLNLGYNALCDDLVPIGSTRECTKYPVEVLFCSTCYTAHQRFQVNKTILFPQEYHYRARATGSVLAGMQDLVRSYEEKFGSPQDKLVLDIGCNDGSLLDFFQVRGARTAGIEPTNAAQDSRHSTLQGYFDEEAVNWVIECHGQPDVVCFTNVFAHIEDLSGLLNSLGRLLGPNTVVVIENHYLGAVVDYLQFDTFYHEHPRTYSFRSFEFIANRLGLNVNQSEIVSRYGGNIRVFMSSDRDHPVSVDESSLPGRFSSMAPRLEMLLPKQLAMVEELVAQNGPLPAKAFPGRAALVLEALKLNESHISAIYEIEGSLKVNHYAPGTRIPILPEATLYSNIDQDRDILNLAWHLPAEVRANLSRHGYRGRVVDILPFSKDW